MHARGFGSVFLGVVAVSLLGACAADSGRRDDPSSRSFVPSSGSALPVGAQVVHRDARTGLPRFAWLESKTAKGAMRGMPPRDVAWSTLRGLANAYGLRRDTVASAEIESVHDTGFGPVIARFKQRVDGVEVFRSQMSLAFTRDMDPVAATGSLARVPRLQDRKAFQLDARAAVASAARAAGTTATVDDVTDAGALSGDYSRFVLSPSALGDRRELSPTRARKIWFEGAKGLEPAWYTEIELGSDGADDAKLRSFVVSAIDGTVLFTNEMTANDANTYRVYADPTGPRAFHPYNGPQGHGGFPHPVGTPNGFQAPFVASELVTLQNVPFSQNDPWLAADATTTTGNNVDAFANIVAPDGFQEGDVRPTATAPGVFDFTFDHATMPGSSQTNMQAAATHLFYTVNFLHDWFYDAGYDEAAHNPQLDNYGRGGTDGDPIVAQAQDVGGRNNANASTPADGASPRIRMYLFDGNATMKVVTPSGDMKVGTMAFGPKSFLQAGDVAVASPILGCTPLDNPDDVAGKIVYVDRGTCSAIVKVANAQAAGAIGVVIANNQPGAAPGFTAGPEVDASTITIPALAVSQSDGAALLASVAAGPMNVTLRRDDAIDRDGALDTGVIAHEWGHTLSNRLIGNGNGIAGTQARGMGEGWGDFTALLTLTRPDDGMAPSNSDWGGTFGLGGYLESGGENEGYYYGMRRVPYSVNLSKNPLTFRHIENGVALPSTSLIAFGLDGKDNAEVHNVGEVWATMLWECYVSLLRDPRYTFEQANDRMRRYLVASLKLTPNTPSMTEARDAVLAAAYATDKQDFNHFVLAFARRGAGTGAVAPSTDSTTNSGVAESYVSGADVAIASAKIEGTTSPCNPYGILRNGESGKLTVTLHNSGTAPLLGTTITLSSPSGQMTFPNGGVVNVAPILPFQSVTAVVDVSLQGAATGAALDTVIDVTDPDLAQPRTVSLTHTAEYDYDVALASSRTDLLDTPVSVWTTSSDETLESANPWSLITTGLTQRWSVRDSETTSDYSLVTPPLEVGTSGTFKLTFDHRYSFERSSKGRNFDAGVIEISIDDGATWFDIGALAAPGYTGIVDFDGSTNPLKMRSAFVGQSAGYPAYQTTTVDLGASFAGLTVKIRFRAGSDEGTGAAGWDISKVSIDGITNTPFPSRAPVGVCAAPAPVDPQ